MTALVAIIMNYVKKPRSRHLARAIFNRKKDVLVFVHRHLWGSVSIAGMVGAAIAVWMGKKGVIIIFIAGCICLVPAAFHLVDLPHCGWLALSNNKPAPERRPQT